MNRVQRQSTHKRVLSDMLIRLFLMLSAGIQPLNAGQTMETSSSVKLPQPRTDSGVAVEQALHLRRSVRDFTDRPLALDEVAQLLWSAQGITSADGLRTAPSAGALYPLELYLVAGHVNGLPAGVWHYLPRTHHLERVDESDVRPALAQAALGQAWLREAAAVVVFTAVYERTGRKYGRRGRRYVHIEAGHFVKPDYGVEVFLAEFGLRADHRAANGSQTRWPRPRCGSHPDRDRASPTR